MTHQNDQIKKESRVQRPRKNEVTAEREEQSVESTLLRQAAHHPAGLDRAGVSRLHTTLGNKGVGRLIQTKLTVNAVGDKYEQEADAVAKTVVQKLNSSEARPGELAQRDEGQSGETIAQRIQRQGMAEEEEPLQTKALQREDAVEDEEMMAMRQEEDEETLLAKTIQRQGMAEEEEPLQTKALQREEAVEDEEMMAMRQEEEEETLQAKMIQRQEMTEEEEPLQAKAVQREEAVEDEEMMAMRQEEEEERLQAKEIQRKGQQDFSQGGAVSSDVEQRIEQARGGGQPMTDEVRLPMEQAFGIDFSDVRIHTNDEAHALNEAVQAKAFTTGSDIFFRSGEHEPLSSSGKELLAHELTHVIQQNSPTISRTPEQSTKLPFNRYSILENRILEYAVAESGEIEIKKNQIRKILRQKSVSSSDDSLHNWLNKFIDLYVNKNYGIDSKKRIWLKRAIGYYLQTSPKRPNKINNEQDKSRLMEGIHTALDIAGFIPGLGIVPDALNTGIYLIEGDWVNAGVSAAAMVPIFGDGAKLAYKGGKEVIEASGKSLLKKGKKKVVADIQIAHSKANITKPANPGFGEKFIKPEQRTNLSVDAAAQAHKQKVKFRGGSGKDIESAHLVPSVAVKNISTYSRSKALTLLLPKHLHRAFDGHWMSWARRKAKELRKQGLPEQMSVEEWEKALNEAIESVPELEGRMGQSMSFMIRTELYQTLGLKSGDMLPLPRFQ